jgi:hypothetical protein
MQIMWDEAPFNGGLTAENAHSEGRIRSRSGKQQNRRRFALINFFAAEFLRQTRGNILILFFYIFSRVCLTSKPGVWVEWKRKQLQGWE